MSEQREPDISEDPREQEVGEGYPETAPDDANPDDDEDRLPDE